MSDKRKSAIAVIGIDIGKYSFHIVGLDERGAIVLRQKWSRSQVEARKRSPRMPSWCQSRSVSGLIRRSVMAMPRKRCG